MGDNLFPLFIMNKIAITIFFIENDPNTGSKITINDKSSKWEDLTRDQQIILLNTIASHFELFAKFLKEE